MKSAVLDGEKSCTPARYCRVVLLYLMLAVLWCVVTVLLPRSLPQPWSVAVSSHRYLADVLFVLLTLGMLYRAFRRGDPSALPKPADPPGPAWRTVVEAFGAIILLVDEHGIIIDCNEQATQTYHYTRDELLGMPYDRLQVVDQASSQRVWQSGTIGRGIVFEEVHRDNIGSTFPVAVSVRTLSVQGRLQHFLDIRDITERNRTEAALAKERFLFNTLMENTPDAIFFKDLEGRYLRVNRGLSRYFGQEEPMAVIGRTEFDFLPMEDARVSAEEDRRIIAAGEPLLGSVKMETWPHLGDIWVSTTKLPLHDVEGKIIGTFGISRDISDYVGAEEALRRQERFLASIFASIQDGISVLDAELNILQVNPAMERWFADQASLVGKKCYQVYYGRNTACEECPSLHTIQTGKSSSAYLPQYDADGKIKHWFELHSFPLVDANTGQVTGVIEYVHDITKRKAMEDELRHKTVELADSNAELQQFAYVASHDLQEPLRMVASYVQLLERRYKGQLDSDADEFIAFAVDGASRMKTLINDLLMYSRVGTQAKPFEPVDCNAILSRALTNLQVSIVEKDAKVTADPLPTITGDELQLQQLFQNLIGNAIKFHKPDEPPIVQISATVDGKGAMFAVKDNGIGIDVRYADRIFAIFQRLHGKGEYPGTGIGLAICKKIVDRHGGKIWIESEVGQGATFHFFIPKNPHKARAAKTVNDNGKLAGSIH